MDSAVAAPDVRGPRTARALRVGIFGRLASGNIGNDATLDALLAYLERDHPQAHLDAMSSSPDAMAARYGFPATQLHWLHSARRVRRGPVARFLTGVEIGVGLVIDAWRTASWVRRHDVVIVPGMGVLETTLLVRPWQMPYSLFALSACGRVFRTPVAFVSVGANPLPRGITRWLLTSAARLASYRSFRDEYSRQAMRGMGLRAASDQVFADLAFALPTTPSTSTPRGPAVGVGVIAWFGTSDDRHEAQRMHDGYLATMKALVARLVASGHGVRLLTGDAVDEPVAREILDGAGDYIDDTGVPRVVFEPVTSMTELLEQMARVDAVIASRFHNVLAALKCSKPTLAIGYGEKHRALMAQMGMADYFQNIRELDVDLLEDQFAALQADREQVISMLSVRSAENRRRLESQFADISTLLSATAGKP